MNFGKFFFFFFLFPFPGSGGVKIFWAFKGFIVSSFVSELRALRSGEVE